MDKEFSITKVYTKNIVTDSFQGIRNLFGLRLRGYENMINRGTKEVIAEAKAKYGQLNWWKLSVNPLTNGSAMITIFGESK